MLGSLDSLSIIAGLPSPALYSSTKNFKDSDSLKELAYSAFVLKLLGTPSHFLNLRSLSAPFAHRVIVEYHTPAPKLVVPSYVLPWQAHLFIPALHTICSTCFPRYRSVRGMLYIFPRLLTGCCKTVGIVSPPII